MDLDLSVLLVVDLKSLLHQCLVGQWKNWEKTQKEDKKKIFLTHNSHFLMEGKNNTIYWWFWIRFLASLINSWWNLLIVPIFYNIYLYFTQWQSIWYRALWLRIYEKTEKAKASKRRLLWRSFLKYLFHPSSVSTIWFIVTFVFFSMSLVIDTPLWEEQQYLDIIKNIVNYLLGMRGFLSLIILVGNIIAISVSPKKTAIYDLLAWTIVIKESSSNNKTTILIGLLLVLVNIILIISLPILSQH